MHLEWHQWRFEWSFQQYYGYSASFRIDQLLEVPKEYAKGLIKCRFCYNDQHFDLSFQHYFPKSVQIFKLVYEDNIDYGLKYTDRKPLELLLEKRGDCDDIIIVKEGEITDTSYSNLVFFDGREWLTSAKPLLAGTNRARLLGQGIIKESSIRLESLPAFFYFKMINAMLPFSTQPAFPISAIKK